MPSPSSSTITTTPSRTVGSSPGAPARTRTETVALAVPDAVLDQVHEDLGELVRVGQHLGQVVVDVEVDRPGGARPRPTRRSGRSARPASHGRGYICRRPVSIRATSSSSAISRLSRSLSAETVSSISFFWSSLSRSQRLSSAWTKPLTPVSGRAQLVGDRGHQVGPLAVQPGPAASGAQGDRHPVDRPVEGGPVELGRHQDLGPVGQQPGLLRARRSGSAGPRRAGCGPTQPLPSWSVRASTNSSGWPDRVALDAEHPHREGGDRARPGRARRRRPRRRAARRRSPARPRRPRRHLGIPSVTCARAPITGPGSEHAPHDRPRDRPARRRGRARGPGRASDVPVAHGPVAPGPRRTRSSKAQVFTAPGLGEVAVGMPTERVVKVQHRTGAARGPGRRCCSARRASPAARSTVAPRPAGWRCCSSATRRTTRTRRRCTAGRS